MTSGRGGQVPSREHLPSLVSTAWLAAELETPHLRILDATYYLPTERRDARALFCAAHLPGAQFFDIDCIADQQSTLPHMAPTVTQFEQCASTLGIGNADRVVFYDQRGLYSAARGWWLLRLFGHDRVAVLDGGLPKWRREGRALLQGTPSPPPRAQFQAVYRPQLVRSAAQLLANLLNRNELVLDARSRERFLAQSLEPRAGVRGGHIPHSLSLPHGELLTADGTLLEPAALRQRFAQLGIDSNSRVVTSCGSGVTAAVISLALSVAGLPCGALYDGSWAEWGSRQDTPIEV